MMRYITFTLDPPEPGVHPAGHALAATDGVSRKRLVHVNALMTGDGLLFYQLEGDPGAALDALRSTDTVIDQELMDETEDSFYLYAYVEPGEPAGTLMFLVQRYALIVETPIEFVGDGAIEVTVAGKQEMLKEAFHQFPDHIDVEIHQAGEYGPDHQGLLASLTDRQLEVLETAAELGYYELPRKVNRKDIAAALDCSTSTVDEHIRKAETRLLSALVG
ncbi:helix-turn-helix domain-containing protein [Haloarchaeobius sp. TZWSO28]|uniref:helix-turn-helix domain-containing protein n=1 Tax=Haloarchaeobius sp. TZWSO28 TaxID=3446119 RepID=UPI003EB8DE39